MVHNMGHYSGEQKRYPPCFSANAGIEDDEISRVTDIEKAYIQLNKKHAAKMPLPAQWESR